MAARRVRRQQPKLAKGCRIPTSSALHPEVERNVALTAKHFDCSKSWVRHVAIAAFFGIKVESFK